MRILNFNFKELSVYYEIHGSGPVLLVLNGLMMTTKSWEFALEALCKENTVVLVDMVDQGQTSSASGTYSQALQVELLYALLEELKIKSVNLFGISYGGEVALQFALKYGQCVDKLILSNTCAYTSYWLREIGRGWVEAMASPLAFYLATIPIIYSPNFFNSHRDWMEARKTLLLDLFQNKQYLARIRRLIDSAEDFDVLDKIDNITNATLIIGARDDGITPIAQQRELASRIPNSSLVVIENCGHASMYEKPNEFLSLILGFLKLEKQVEL